MNAQLLRPHKRELPGASSCDSSSAKTLEHLSDCSRGVSMNDDRLSCASRWRARTFAAGTLANGALELPPEERAIATAGSARLGSFSPPSFRENPKSAHSNNGTDNAGTQMPANPAMQCARKSLDEEDAMS